MTHLPRLLRILNVVARYGLDDFLDSRHGLALPRLLFRIYRLPWSGRPERKLPRSRRLRLAMQELGPIYIKFGQLLSTRRDFLDPQLADELQALQDKVPPFDSPAITELVEQALGQPAASVFASLDPAPLASASVAQVHGARLLTGEDVVVKVIRPGIEAVVREDIALLKWLARRIESDIAIGKRLRPVQVIDDYEKVILDELNLLAEGANTALLRRNFENSDELYVPRVFWNHCRSNMLVMERIYGIPVADVKALTACGIDLRKLAETGVQIFFTQVFDHSFFHADMHPGNIFVDPTRPDKPRYIAIDCAIIGSLSQDDQQYLARNLLAIFKRDYRKVAQLHVECGWVPPNTPVQEFEAAMRTVCEPIFERPLKEISFGHLLVQLFRTAGRFNMEVQPSLVLLQKTLLNVEGLGRQLYPELDLWQTALPFLENWNRKRLNPLLLLQRIRENIPDWIHQLPDLPRLLIDAATDNRQLEALRGSLTETRLQALREQQARRRGAVLTGTVALLLALLSLYPPLANLLDATPAIALVLAATGGYLLLRRY
ncbi:MAG: hypothetical protein RLZZ385_2530 [Pseudomonadota bacterium]|jgi:ubiquinone biosynthesis protein